MDPAVLLQDYNNYFFKTAYAHKRRQEGAYVGALKGTLQRLHALKTMALWCQARGIDPRHWLYSLFVSRRWTYAPQWNQLTSEKHIARYNALRHNDLFQKQVQAEWKADRIQRGTEFDWNRDLSATAEGAKRRYVQTLRDPDKCLAAVRDETLGYHPKSTICQACPRASDCERLVRALAPGFDILALRRGDITMEQAQEQARSAAHGTP